MRSTPYLTKSPVDGRDLIAYHAFYFGAQEVGPYIFHELTDARVELRRIEDEADNYRKFIVDVEEYIRTHMNFEGIVEKLSKTQIK
jgi:hypothetical protein